MTTWPHERLKLTEEESAMLSGAEGPAKAFAMDIIVRLARILGAGRLVEIESAHIDGCLFHGQVGVDFVERLVSLDAHVAVPTTLNVGSLDLLHPALVHADQETTRLARRLMDGYTALGATPTWTCAPYQLEAARPRFGAHIAWAESNAIAFANSVLGARTDRYGDFLDVSAAITGRAPMAGLHLDRNRRAELVFDCSNLPDVTLGLDAAWAALGHLVGGTAGNRVPVLVGCPSKVDEDKLKAFGAAAASSGGTGLFHVVGSTPEAPTLDAVLRGEAAPITVVTSEMLCSARDQLSTSDGTEAIDAVSVGTPHMSEAELERLAELLGRGGPVAHGVEFWINTSRYVLAKAEESGAAGICRSAGAKILVDTCTYVTPVLRRGTRVVMTNSAKWAWYAPSNLGVETVFGSLEECVTSARQGRVWRKEEEWGMV